MICILRLRDLLLILSGGLKFLYDTDVLLRTRWISKKDQVEEIFVNEMEEMLEVLRRDGEEVLQSYERIRSEYSDLYGENSAWN